MQNQNAAVSPAQYNEPQEPIPARFGRYGRGA